MRLRPRAGAFLLLLAACGCAGGDGQPKTLVAVWGKVSFDGAPVDEGFIDFEHAPGRWIQGSHPISRGEYRGELPPGSYVVRIHASRPAKPGEPGYGPDGYIMFIPDRYSAKSTLKIDVPPEGGEFSFALTSQPSPNK